MQLWYTDLNILLYFEKPTERKYLYEFDRCRLRAEQPLHSDADEKASRLLRICNYRLSADLYKAQNRIVADMDDDMRRICDTAVLQ